MSTAPAAFRGFGRALRDARKARRIDQRHLARRLGLAQQTVSRWERGISRPDSASLVNKLSAIFPENQASEWLALAGYLPKATDEARSNPVRPLLDQLPLPNLSFKEFQNFSTLFVSLLYKDLASVNQFGVEGDTQDGIDIEARFRTRRRYETFQCKREKSFGPEKIKRAIRAHRVTCTRAVILLSRAATAMARREINRRRKKRWELWDADDICRSVRQLPLVAQRQLVATYFPAYVNDFLGIREGGALATLDEYRAPFMRRDLVFAHAWTLVGRDAILERVGQLVERESFHATFLLGSGGIGKTRLALAVGDQYALAHPDHAVYMVSSGRDLSPADFVALRERPSLVIVDDAQDHPHIAQLLGLLARTSPAPHVLIVARTFAGSVLRGEATRAGYRVDETACVAVQPLSTDEGEIVAREILDGTPLKHHARRIASLTMGSTIALVVGSHLVATRRIRPDLLANDGEFHSVLFGKFRDEISRNVGSRADRDSVNAVLDLVALIQPFNPDSTQFSAIASEALSFPLTRTKQIIQGLIEAGVLVRRGQLLRLIPDLLGEFLVESTCLAGDARTSTGYVEPLLPHAGDEILSNILLNVSRLDWRIRTGGTSVSPLADIVWRVIESSTNRGETSATVLEAVSNAAYYQPRRALGYFDAIHKTEVSRRPLSTLLRHVAMTIEHTDAACERLWELGRGDTRLLNPHPDHPRRILRDFAQIEPHKPIEFCARVVDFALRKLRTADSTEREHLFEILHFGLLPGGHTTEARGPSIQFSRFSVRLSAVADLRKQILDALFAFMLSSDLNLAGFSVRTIAHALHGPDDGADGPEWQGAFVEVIERLRCLIEDRKDLDPIILVGIARAVLWHAECGRPPARDSARNALGAISWSLPYRITLAMADAWGWTQRKMDRLHESIEEWRREQESIAMDLISSEATPQGVVNVLEDRLAAVSQAQKSTDSSPGIFVSLVSRANTEVATAICRRALDNRRSELRAAFGDALLPLWQEDSEFALTLAREGLAQSDDELAARIAWAYDVRSRTHVATQEERTLLATLANHQNEFVARIAVRTIGELSSVDAHSSLELLLSLNPSRSAQFLDAYAEAFINHKDALIAPLNGEAIESLLGRMLATPTLDGYDTTRFIGELSARHPELVVNFCLQRIEYWNDGIGTDNHQPIPHGWDHESEFKFSESPRFMECLRRVREWLLHSPDHPLIALWAGDLYQAIAQGSTSAIVVDLAEWANSADPARLSVIAKLLRRAPSGFVFEERAFVSNILSAAFSLSEQSGSEVQSALFGSALCGIRQGLFGQPFPEDVYRRDRAQEAMQAFSPGTPAWRLFSALARDAERDIQKSNEGDERLSE